LPQRLRGSDDLRDRARDKFNDPRRGLSDAPGPSHRSDRPGGGYDVFGRIVGDQLSRRLGQAVVVENRTGAGTIVGTQSVIASQPDGYTLLVGGLSNIVFNASLQ
jgi:hypothetical protein